MASSEIQPHSDDLDLLVEISQILDESLDLSEVVGPTLTTLAEHTGMVRGAVTLLNRERKEVSIEAGYGLTNVEMRRGNYKLGEGITGKVVEKGEMVVIPRISQEPEFLNRTNSRKINKGNDYSFICAPVRVGSQTLGAISGEWPWNDEIDPNELARVLAVLASMIGQAARIRQQVLEEREQLEAENERLQRQLREQFTPDNIIGKSKQMQAVFDLMAQVLDTDTTVLIRGESGTGKELVAQAIHYNSQRAGRPFIKVNCAALPESVIESELFGHEKGAFTGATAQRKGRFELADGGTIFLDEIGELTLSTQVRLLRVLQEREFERVGGTKTLSTDVRVIAATNRDLEEAIKENTFREDLYYRLNVFPIALPALRERPSDIMLLADHFVQKYNERHGKSVRRISTPAIDMLTSYHWPGNVRELENCIERAVLLSQDDVIHGHQLPPSLQSAEASGTTFTGGLQASLDTLERELVIDALKATSGNMARAARQLGITERVMGLRVKKYDIEPRRFRG
jgi:Nif-specific regulatory protein